MTRGARERFKDASTNAASARLPPTGLRSNSKKLPTPWWKVLGPGIVSGASDNDPTTVASLAVIGSTTVYGLSWLVLLIIPMLAVVQAISAQVGVVMNVGLENAVRRHYGKYWALLALASVLIVNLMTLAADLEGGGAALSMLVHLDYRWFVVPLGAGSGFMLIFGNYKRIQHLLIYLPLVFLSYVAAAFLARPQWRDVLRDSLIPQFSFTGPMVAGAIALLGTTLTAYSYVWETIEMSEETTPYALRSVHCVRGLQGMAVGAQLARQVHGHLPRQIGKSGTDTQCCFQQAYPPKVTPQSENMCRPWQRDGLRDGREG